MNFPDRMTRVREAFAAAECDALLVTRLVNIRYLTGFTGSAALLLVLADDAVFVTDGRYRDQSADQLGAAGVEVAIRVGLTRGEQQKYLTDGSSGTSRIGLEAEAVTWAQQRRFASEWFPDAELIPTEGLVEGLRRVKEEGEIDRIAAAAHIADQALAVVAPSLADGVTEREFALALDFEMRRQGADGSSFDTIVAAGENGAKPHARPSGRTVNPGELVVVDFGAIVDGYCSDMTRTLCVGEPASDTARRMVEVVSASQRAGVEAVRAGVDGQSVDRACREVIASAGWADAFLHSTGHGVGLEIHEAPTVSSGSDDALVEGHVITVEPGVYLPEHGGVRIEDTVVVTADGCRILTEAPKELVIA